MVKRVAINGGKKQRATSNEECRMTDHFSPTVNTALKVLKQFTFSCVLAQLRKKILTGRSIIMHV